MALRSTASSRPLPPLDWFAVVDAFVRTAAACLVLAYVVSSCVMILVEARALRLALASASPKALATAAQAVHAVHAATDPGVCYDFARAAPLAVTSFLK